MFCYNDTTRNPLVIPSQADLLSDWTSSECANVFIAEVKGDNIMTTIIYHHTEYTMYYYYDNYHTNNILKGADGTQVAPRGLTGNRLDKQISDLNLANASYNVYIDQVLRALPIFAKQEEGLVISNRVGPSSVKGLRVNRYETEINLLDASYRANYPDTPAATLQGVGVPRDGVAYFGYTTAFNSYFSKPNYLYGDYPFFLDAQTGLVCDLDDSNPASLRPDFFPSCSGNSIEVWRCYDDSVVPPVRLEGPDCVRQDSNAMGTDGSSNAAATAERYDTYLKIEKATGTYINHTTPLQTRALRVRVKVKRV